MTASTVSNLTFAPTPQSRRLIDAARERRSRRIGDLIPQRPATRRSSHRPHESLSSQSDAASSSASRHLDTVSPFSPPLDPSPISRCTASAPVQSSIESLSDRDILSLCHILEDGLLLGGYGDIDMLSTTRNRSLMMLMLLQDQLTADPGAAMGLTETASQCLADPSIMEAVDCWRYEMRAFRITARAADPWDRSGMGDED